MLTGKELGTAIAKAIKLKGVAKAAVARHFGIKPPSISDWVNRGTIDKAKLDDLFSYFSDVVGPEHWGLKRGDVTTSNAVRQERAYYHSRQLVQQVCELAEQISDDGLRELIGFARCLTGSQPVAKQTRKSSA